MLKQSISKLKKILAQALEQKPYIVTSFQGNAWDAQRFESEVLAINEKEAIGKAQKEMVAPQEWNWSAKEKVNEQIRESQPEPVKLEPVKQSEDVLDLRDFNF